MNKPKISQREIVITTSWWSFWFVVQTLVYHRTGFNWTQSFTDACIATTVLAISGFVISNTFKYYRPVYSNFWLLFAYIIVLSAINIRTINWLFQTAHRDNEVYHEQFNHDMPLRTMSYLMMIAFMTAYYYYINKIREQGDVEEREKEAGILMRDAELARLRQQLQPHFLFNSLNSISALAGSKPEQARQMVQQLSDFLRGTLRKDEQQFVALTEEFRLVALYLEIEKVRFGHRLSTNMTLDKTSETMKLPPLLLQPIVENAVKFGLYDTIDSVTIRITAHAENNILFIQIENPYDPSTAKPITGTGFGLSSVQRRLYLLFGRNDLLETKSSDHTFITLLKIPQKP